MKNTAEESAELKMALKHDPVTDKLRAEAAAHPQEADEAYREAEANLDTYAPDSWVAEQIEEGPDKSGPSWCLMVGHQRGGQK